MGKDENEYILFLKDCKNSANPIYVDFNEYNKNSNELIKACGINNKESILDCTAGLCKDTFILASNGYNVVAIEKNKIIFSLLEDGFLRGHNYENISKTLKKIKILNEDSINFLKETNSIFNCIYLDPMFEKSKKSRLVKKEMQFFHNLIDIENNNDILFKLAFNKAKNRIVVKRPLYGDFITNELKTSFQVKGKSIRYDVYLK